MTFSERHRDKNGRISRKHGNTLVRTLRKIYGASFAPGFADTDLLKDVLDKLDEPSLSHLHRDHDGGALDKKIAESWFASRDRLHPRRAARRLDLRQPPLSARPARHGRSPG